ncbi:protein FAR1-RELATED SEQUENCE 5-like [Arachis ipaensis]|nr:protein FAR1-RELATED SEQUENCE 5-like [Arachis ipaensis]XP_025628255.1 protein FAR1-RELATED SEQUENCE 5-like [Arachis hypogaea]
MMHGFAVRLDEVRRDSDGCVIMRQIVCNRVGSRKEEVEKDERIRDHQPLNRSCCLARIRARLDRKIHKWKVVSLYEEHSHGLVDPLDINMMSEYRTFSVSNKAQAKNLHDISIRTCHILEYLATKKVDIQTCHSTKKICTTSLLNTERKRNIYNKPLVIFSSSNHHGNTVIFGCGLLVNEDIGSYKWLLKTFLEAMGNKYPMAVVTDGDLSMREAIKQVFPYATHRLCAWNLHRHACEKVKNSGFLNDFRKLIYDNVSVEEFEVMWGDMVARYNLSSNCWVDQTYKLRNLWALAYLRNQFFRRIRTTSQCEGINFLIKVYVRKKDTLLEFINNMETVVSHYRNNERDAEFNSKYTDPELVTSLPALDGFAAKNFTRNMFQEVRKEIEGACAMNTELVMHRNLSLIRFPSDGGKLYFKCNSFGMPKIDHVVEFDRVGGLLCCECLWFKNRRILLMRIFACLKSQHVEVIPECLVCKRWTKHAKSDFMKSNVDDPSDSDKVLKCRLGVLGAECSRLMDVASKNSSDFVEAMNDIVNTITNLQKQGENPRNGNLDDDDIVDPLVVKSKGSLGDITLVQVGLVCGNLPGERSVEKDAVWFVISAKDMTV